MLSKWKILIMLVCLVGAVLAIGFKIYPYGRTGVEIAFISADSPASNVLKTGMILTSFNGQPVPNPDTWSQLSNITGPVKLTANGKEYSLFVNQSIGIDVMEMQRLNLDLGLDLRGGTRILLKPKGNATKEVIDDVISTLQTRANIYGLREMSFTPIGAGDEWYVQIEAAGLGSDVVENLLSKQGKFEAKVLKPVTLSGNKGNIVVGDRSYPVSLDNETLVVNGQGVEINGTFELENITFQYLNTSQNKALLLATVLKGNDVQLVYTDPQHAGLQPQGSGWSFYFAILVSEAGAKRFADVTTGIPKYLDVQSGEEYLDSKILLLIDDQGVSELNIGSSLGGQVVNTPQIQGSRSTREEAVAEKQTLQTILRSGALPVSLETASVAIISPTLGTGFIVSAGIAGILAAVAVGVIVFIRYRTPKVALPIIFIVLTEIVMIIGIAATGDSIIWGAVLLINAIIIGLAWWKKQETDILSMAGALLIPALGFASWTIDLPAIAGIIAAIGTGVGDQIIIADESLKGNKEERKVYTQKEKIKRAFFIVFGGAAIVIGAMMPLMFLGVGLVRGFAITTIIGVLVGILVTRPAYAQIIEATVKD